MAGLTNKGIERMMRAFLRGEGSPTHFYVALVTNDIPITEDVETLGDLVEVADGNGYTEGGQEIAASSVGFDLVSVDTDDDETLVQLADLTWTASGGDIQGISYVVLLDDNPTPSSRNVIAWWQLSETITIPDGSTATFSGFGLTGKVGLAVTSGGSSATPAGAIFHEKWDGSGYPLTYRDTTPSYEKSWSRELSIDQNGDSRQEPGAPLRSDEVVDGVYVGAEIIDFDGRKVLDLYCAGNGEARELGAKVPLVGTNNWQYDAWANYAGDVIYLRYFTYVPEFHMDMDIGSWCILGTQIKTTELWSSAGYQQHIEPDGEGGFRWWHMHIDPTDGMNVLLKQTTSEPRPKVKLGQWQKHDIELRMSYGSGYIKHWIDDVLVFENSGIMGDDPGASIPDVANFYVLLHGNIFADTGVQHLYIGDIIASTTSIR